MENFEAMLDEYLPNVEEGGIQKGILAKKDKDYSYIDILGLKGLGKLRTEEVAEYEVGDEIEVKIMRTDEEEGDIRVSRTAVELEKNFRILEEAHEAKEVVSGVISKKVKGGYIVDLMKYKCFMPGSLSMIKDNEASVEGMEVEVIVKNIEDGKRKKILVSRKDVLEGALGEFFEKLEVGQEVEVEIKEILGFGLSVQYGPVVGFIHISEIAWKRVDSLEGLYQIGEKINAKIIEGNKDKRSVKFSIKQLKTNPWENVAEKYPIGTEIDGEVVRVEKYGAFVEIEEGVEGLVHVSDLSWSKKLKNVSDFLKLGDKVNVKVIELDVNSKKLKLSVKDLSANPWDLAIEKYPMEKIITGKVVDKKPFGIFVEAEEGIDIFVHVSDLKWINPTVNEYEIGDSVEVQIIELDLENKKIKGGVKQLSENPWDEVFGKFAIGDIVKRKIVNIAPFGIFVEMEDGIDGMVHISESSKEFIKDLNEKFTIGDEIEAKIIEMDKDNKKIKLSIKELELEETKQEDEDLIEKYGTTAE